MRRRGALLPVLLGVALLGAVLYLGRPRSEGPPLDPRSDAADGTSALVALGRRLGAEIDVVARAPGPRDDVFVVLVDTLDPAAADATRRWVEGGGTLVLTSPFTEVLPNLPADPTGGVLELVPEARGVCDIAALDGLAHIDTGAAEDLFASVAPLAVGPGDRSCVGDGRRAFVVARPVGDGWVVGTASPAPLVNARLGEADNAVLGAALVAPGPAARVALLDPLTPVGDAAHRDLLDVLSPGVKRTVVQLVIAFVLFALFKARRLGPVIHEPLPVQIAGSELTAAVGDLLQQARDPSAPAHLLRQDLRRTLRDRLGIPLDAPPEVVADIVAARTGAPRDRVLAAVDDAAVASDAELVQLGRSIEALRQEVLT